MLTGIDETITTEVIADDGNVIGVGGNAYDESMSLSPANMGELELTENNFTYRTGICLSKYHGDDGEGSHEYVNIVQYWS